jgi:hypothetical protein
VPPGKLHLPLVRIPAGSGFDEVSLEENPDLAPGADEALAA